MICLRDTRTEEKGRSLFETLGVLAIMGLLSIVGLYGYTSAMNRHRANELLDEALKRATLVAGQLAAGNEVPETASDGMFGGLTDPSSAYTFKVKKKNNDQFYMEIDGVSKSVCALMGNALGSAVRDVDCPEEEGLATLTFNNDMSTGSKPGDNDGDKTACEAVGNQYCESLSKCIGPEETCPNCPEAPACPEGVCCWLDGPDDACGHPTARLGFRDKEGTCHDCSSDDYPETDSSECARCQDESGNPTRQWMSSTGYCMKSCPEAPVCPEGECCWLDGPDDACGRPTARLGFRSDGGVCYDCSHLTYVNANATECARCKDENGNSIREEIVSGICTLTKDACHAKNGFYNGVECVDCLEGGMPTIIDATECNICKDESGNSIREMVDGNCALTADACYANGGFRGGMGVCYDCFNTSPHYTSSTECAICKDENGNSIRELKNGIHSGDCVLTEAACTALGGTRSGDYCSGIN